MKILLADDDLMALDLMSVILSSSGFDVVPVKDGLELVEKLDESIDVIITEVKLPKISAYDIPQLLIEYKVTAPVSED